MRLIDPKKIPKMGEPTTLEDTPMYEFAQCLVDYLVENYGVDVPDIVRCKDCKYSTPQTFYDKGVKGLFCNYRGSIGDWRYRTTDDYCSRGERKDEVGE